MLERRSALADVALDTPPTDGVTLSERPIAGAWLLMGWNQAIVAQAEAAARAMGLAGMPVPQRALAGEDGLLMQTGPGRYFAVAAADGVANALREALAPEHCVDVGSARTWLRVTGIGARTLLDREMPLDLRAAAFPRGAAAQSVLGRVDVLVHAAGAGEGADEVFDLLVARSFAAFLAECLLQE